MFLVKGGILILKFVKNVNSQCGDVAAQHMVCVRACARTHTICYAAASPH